MIQYECPKYYREKHSFQVALLIFYIRLLLMSTLIEPAVYNIQCCPKGRVMTSVYTNNCFPTLPNPPCPFPCARKPDLFPFMRAGFESH